MFILGRNGFAMAPEGDEGGTTDASGDAGGAPRQPVGVSKEKFSALEEKYNTLISKQEADKEAARIAKATEEGRQGEELLRVQETNKKLQERLAKTDARDAEEADKIFESLSEDAQGRFEKLKDQLDARAWLQFLRQEQRVADANKTNDDDDIDDDDIDDEGGTGVRPRKAGGKGRKLAYEKEAVVKMDEELGRETIYLPKMNIKRDALRGSEYTLGKRTWLNGIKGKTDHGERLDEDTARAVLGNGRRERNTRTPTKGKGK